MTKRKIFNISLVLGFIASILLSMTGFDNSCNEIRENIIRIRIIANSDSTIDQELKIKIRDSILAKSATMFKSDSYKDAVLTAKKSIEELNDIALNTVINEGFNYNVTTEFRKEFFETRVYEDFTLPAGYYDTVVFTVGEGKGQNWWCVIYPEVCVGSCSAKLNDTISDKSSAYAYSGEKYVIKFKTVEIFEKIKEILK